ncbi:hypothetical protein [Frigoriflavimonas asaccharolytica]|uniref:Uncharacterized protein n=1 Tax=Frigoriflavimonas asaccharolytica TaxID=2735899 RepID=A0A8J8GCT4_9FLAO|nr:hypothetical protein [Frigoriflavimonas asaccharolytica]NRS93580.1 hypothetical protein [Frigoriflavimonas asaccharolytica]
MNLFYQISTDQYVPLSHDNSYLFAHYDRVHNFIKSRLGGNFKNILAKPIKRNYDVEWFSIFDNLQLENAASRQFALQEYWSFRALLDKELEALSGNPDSDAKNWIELLRKVFNQEDNLIFTNGKDICIIWGWKFENNDNHRPVLRESIKPIEPTSEGIFNEPQDIAIETEDTAIDKEVNLPIEPLEEEAEEELVEEENVVIQEEDNDLFDVEKEKLGFLEFLKEFAAKYWWLLVIILAIIALIYLIKTF